MIKLDIDQAVQILEALGCSDDPIEFRGEEVSPNSILYDFSLNNTQAASRVRIQFWITSGKKIPGSLHTMVRERLGLNIKQIKTKEAKKVKEVVKTYRLYEWGMRGSGIFHPEVVTEIQKDTEIDFLFSIDSFEDYPTLADEIIQQLTDHDFKYDCYSDDDIIIKITIPNKQEE